MQSYPHCHSMPAPNARGSIPQYASIDSDKEHVKDVASKNRLSMYIYNVCVVYTNLSLVNWIMTFPF